VRTKIHSGNLEQRDNFQDMVIDGRLDIKDTHCENMDLIPLDLVRELLHMVINIRIP
jgi:hypothetical protein